MDADKYLSIIAEEVGVPRDELQDDTEFADLGIDRVLAQVITDRFAAETSQSLPLSIFDDFPDVHSFKQHLKARGTQAGSITNCTAKTTTTAQKKKQKPTKKPSLVLPLQGTPATAKKTLFLLPDGSGSGLAYARLPRLGPDICLCGLNSPFLGADSFTTTIESIAATFTAAIREAQPRGPYMLGGWSAGGYFATEVARLLLRAGEAVSCVVLIDSPCRLEYESLPLEVVRFLAPRNFMGNWGAKGTPGWLVRHFEGTLAAVAEYVPRSIGEGRVPEVFVIEAAEGVFGSHEEVDRSGLDQSNMLTRHLLGPRPKVFDPHGWERLYPGAKLRWARSSGSHFTMVHPPHVSLCFLSSPS
jgi:pimeloyl-ACP methyl ester carboxylesterase